MLTIFKVAKPAVTAVIKAAQAPPFHCRFSLFRSAIGEFEPTTSATMASGFLAAEIREPADHNELQKSGSDSISRLIVDCLSDLDETVGECVKVSVEGAGGLGIEHWVGEEARDRPFHSADNFSYQALLGFVTRNRERSSNSQDFLHYISPWYEWALVTAESKLLVKLMSRPEFAGAVKEKLVGQIRETVLKMEKP